MCLLMLEIIIRLMCTIPFHAMIPKGVVAVTKIKQVQTNQLAKGSN
jgi:hypothetical protein